MSYSINRMLLLAMMSTPLFLGACSSRNLDTSDYAAVPGLGTAATVTGAQAENVIYHGVKTSSTRGAIDSSLTFPDGNGNVVIINGTKPQPRNAQFVNARELKLKVREMADQLFSGVDNSSLQGKIAFPVSFVDQENVNNSSPFGRLIAEQLFYELNQRGIPVQEYRGSSTITVQQNAGTTFLSPKSRNVAVGGGEMVIAGTYYRDKDAVFVNARLIRPADGRIVRTANLVLEPNQLTRRMMAQASAAQLEGGTMRIRDTKAPPANQTSSNPFDRGEDIH